MQKISPGIAADLAALPLWVRRRCEIRGECIEWTGAAAGHDGSQPRGWVPGESRQVTLPRHVYEIAHDVQLHPKRAVFRRCLNPKCVRVAHLVAGDLGMHRAPILIEHAPGQRRPEGAVSVPGSTIRGEHGRVDAEVRTKAALFEERSP